MHRSLLSALVLAFLCSLPAVAQIGRSGHSTSVTISPIHLVFPFIEVTSEFKMEPKVGVAAIAGIGSIDDFFAFELGGQARYYLIGDFDHGMQIGGELLYAHVSDNDIQGSGVSANSNGISLGAFLGYKIAFGFGLTFDLQGGIDYMIVRAHAEDNTGATGNASGSRLYPLLNINLGWSF